MLGALKKAAKFVLMQANIGALRYDRLQRLEKYSRAGEDFELLTELPSRHTRDLMLLLHHSRAEFRQDLFVLSQLDLKKNGYFVEFGATNGISTSNTYLLESAFGWRGILAEPAKRWHKELMANRSCNIDTACVWTHSNRILQFAEEEIGERSTLEMYGRLAQKNQQRKPRRVYDVPTISLNDLLVKHSAPNIIDYLSIDTEGSEYDILSSFDFSRFQFRVITCEHNHTQSRDKLYDLLNSHGYVRKFEQFSKVDDWYVLQGHV